MLSCGYACIIIIGLSSAKLADIDAGLERARPWRIANMVPIL